jgi:hypothetical protein
MVVIIPEVGVHDIVLVFFVGVSTQYIVISLSADLEHVDSEQVSVISSYIDELIPGRYIVAAVWFTTGVYWKP